MIQVLGALHFILIVIGVLLGIGCIIAARLAWLIFWFFREERQKEKSEALIDAANYAVWS